MKTSVKSHLQFTASDYEYLSGKGYSDREIVAIWDRDAGLNKSPLTHKSAPDIVGFLSR